MEEENIPVIGNPRHSQKAVYRCSRQYILSWSFERDPNRKHAAKRYSLSYTDRGIYPWI